MMRTALTALHSVHDYIPSPSDGVWHLGPVPIRGYALCIIIGIFAAAMLADRRYRARGGALGVINEISTWAVPFGLVGGRIYHVITDWSDYFGKHGSPIRSLEVWKGGLGIPGAVALGGVGVYIACRRRGVLMPPIADAVAPGLVLAQGIGRWGNWFNQELYGRPTSLPWSVRIDAAHQCGVIIERVPDERCAGRVSVRRFLERVRLFSADVPLRVDLGHRHRHRADPARPQVQARPWPGIRAVPRHLRPWPQLDRGAADRPSAPLLRSATQRLDEHRHRPGRCHRLPGFRAPASQAAKSSWSGVAFLPTCP